MKNLWILSLLTLLVFSACKKDDEELPDDETRVTLSYDGDNQTAPILGADTYDFALRFPASQMATYAGRKLEEVKFYILDKPAECEVRIFDAGTVDNHGAELYSADVISAVSSSSWNSHVLTTPLELTGDDIWVVVRTKHEGNIASIGCDNGPAKDGGDWIYAGIGTSWLTFRTFTGTENVNWNIRAYLADE